MMILIAAVLFLVLSRCNASKYLQPHYRQVRGPYNAEVANFIDSESTGMLSRLADRLRSKGETEGPRGWEPIPDPRMYMLIQLESQGNSPALYQVENGNHEEIRAKRRGPSLSIVNPLEVLQEKWLLSLNRKQKEQIQNNRELFSKIGKRNGFVRTGNGASNTYWSYPLQT